MRIAKAILIVLLAPALYAQTTTNEAARPAFEVASIKPNKSGATGASIRPSGAGGLTATNQTVRNLIRNAYNIQPYQFVGGPSWIDEDRFDIVAKMADADVPARMSQEPFMLRLQTLLADRFKLVVRREKREAPVFALVTARKDAKLGPGLRAASGVCEEAARANTPRPAPVSPTERPCGIRVTMGKVMAGGLLIQDFARNMSGIVNRFILDKTGLTGRYDLDLEWTPDPTADVAGPSIFTAFEEQLGLKLESTRAPIDALIIDSVERPTPD
jgi:uncharacterized protein (TIGR03435 family)